jgi:hypothetical protein
MLAAAVLFSLAVAGPVCMLALLIIGFYGFRLRRDCRGQGSSPFIWAMTGLVEKTGAEAQANRANATEARRAFQTSH